MHCVLSLFLASVCGVFEMLVHSTAAALFRRAKRHYCSILERFILQNLRVKAQSGFRVNFKCYQRSVESLEPTLLRVLTLSSNSRRQLHVSEYQNEFIAYNMNLLALHMNSTKLCQRGTRGDL